jgi:hypothetical protein
MISVCRGSSCSSRSYRSDISREVISHSPMLADYDKVLGRIHGKIGNGKWQLG